MPEILDLDVRPGPRSRPSSPVLVPAWRHDRRQARRDHATCARDPPPRARAAGPLGVHALSCQVSAVHLRGPRRGCFQRDSSSQSREQAALVALSGRKRRQPSCRASMTTPSRSCRRSTGPGPDAGLFPGPGPAVGGSAGATEIRPDVFPPCPGGRDEPDHPDDDQGSATLRADGLFRRERVGELVEEFLGHAGAGQGWSLRRFGGDHAKARTSSRTRFCQGCRGKSADPAPGSPPPAPPPSSRPAAGSTRPPGRSRPARPSNFQPPPSGTKR